MDYSGNLDDDYHLQWLKSKRRSTMATDSRKSPPSKPFGSDVNPFAYAVVRLSSGECRTKAVDRDDRIEQYGQLAAKKLPLLPTFLDNQQ